MQRHLGLPELPFEAMTSHASLVAVKNIFPMGEHCGPSSTIRSSDRKLMVEPFAELYKLIWCDGTNVKTGLCRISL
jgi:hypothetical protein